MLEDYIPKTYSEIKKDDSDIKSLKELRERDDLVQRLIRSYFVAVKNRDIYLRNAIEGELKNQLDEALKDQNNRIADEIKTVLSKFAISHGHQKHEFHLVKNLSAPGIVIPKRLNIFNTLRKFSNEKHFITMNEIYNSKELTLMELREKTGLATNDLNHSLNALKDVDVILKQGNKYKITTYGAILMRSITNINQMIKNNQGKLFDPITTEVAFR